MARDITKQLHPPETPYRRPLDFSPFQSALEKISPARLEAIGRLLKDVTIVKVHAFFEQGALSAEELTLFFLGRIQSEIGRTVNAVIELNPDALKIARSLDRERKAGKERGSLHGIPVLLKDNIGTGDGMYNTAGAAALRDSCCDRDAFLVQRLRNEGAIILGKANLTEWANFMTRDSSNGFSAMGGQTRNPYGPYDVGGSSSGSAAAVASLLTVVAVGTETSGSVIHPAGQNSLFGLKPSRGLVSRDRIIPITSHMDTAGPLARSVTDLAALFFAMQGSDQNDPATQIENPLSNINWWSVLDEKGLKGKRVALVSNAAYNPRKEDRALLRQAAELIRQAGAEVVEMRYRAPAVKYMPVLLYGIQREVDAYLNAIKRTNVRSMAEVVEFNRGDLKARAPYGQNFLEESLTFTMTAEEYDTLAQRNRSAAARAIRKALSDHRADFLMSYSSWLSGSYSTAGFPAVTLPGFYRKNGEPFGITLVGDYLDDDKLLAAAYAFECAAASLRREPDKEKLTAG